MFVCKYVDILKILIIIKIEKGATDRRLEPPKHLSYKEVTASLEDGRLLLCFYQFNNQFYNNAEQRYQQSKYRYNKCNNFICTHKAHPLL